jgi:hypothetical protein
MFKTSRIVSLFIALLILVSMVIPVRAEDEPPVDWSNFFTDTGELRSDVVDGGVVEVQTTTESAFSGNSVSTTETYHVYIADNGDSIVAPTYSTLLDSVTAGQDITSAVDIENADGSYQIGAGTAVSWTTVYSSIAEAIKASSNPTCVNCDSYSSQDDAALQATIDLLLKDLQAANLGNYSEESTGFESENWIYTKNFLSLLLSTGINDETFATTYLYYSAGNCENSPLGCQSICEINPSASVCVVETPKPVAGCPASTIVPGTISMSIVKTAPYSPLVVGQDPDKRGADIAYTATVPPTVYTYYKAIPVYRTVQVCTPNADGSIPAGANCYSGQSSVFNGILEDDEKLDHVDCEKHVLYYAESVTAVKATASLTKQSTDWINNRLSTYYYGAEVQQSSYSLVPGLAAANAYCKSNKTCYAAGTVSKVQFIDPGFYTLSLTISTSGTPVTTGRTVSSTGSMSVSFISVTLIENGGY